MKKQILFCFSSLLMLLLASCSSEELNNEVTENLKKSERSVAGKSAGDGIYDVLGHGYNAAGEYANSNSAGFKVIDINRFQAEQPGRLITENIFSQEYIEEYGENAEAYSKMVSTKVDVTAGFKLFGQSIKAGFNSSVTNTNKFDAKYIYGSYNLVIKQRRLRFNALPDMLGDYLTSEFIQDLQTKTPQQIVQDYGTHVTVDIYTGAKMDLMFQSETTNQDRERAARIGVKVGVGSIFDINVTNDVNTTESNKNYSRKLSYRTRGGDPSKGLVGEVNLEQTNPKINVSNWQNSSTPSNSVLVDFGNKGLILIYDLVKDPTKKAQLKSYVDQYLIDNKVNLDYITNIYSYWNSISKDHYYTPKYANNIGDWNYERISFKAPSKQIDDAVAIYSYWNDTDYDHYYTTVNAATVGGGKWKSDGILFYAYSYQKGGTVPIYQYWNATDKDHYYSVDNLPTAGGGKWINEGIAFYAYSAN
ncbi:MAC/perforin domain-containing protein [uncultured Chryseobacterium sp.]|uniref:MAC/perforin domain-containing protein n=1 Tax=uncultured Chryseobacterium sp. TaxID=259322 RepID=UPI0025D23647|nr:MAC/perforin domain-containing protein [uncultured Chryseobacterium sp.]